MSGNGWIKLMRNEKVLELFKLPNGFALVTQIAQRAKRCKGFDVDGLEIGEAMLGDYVTIGLTRQEYRTALKKVKKLGIATFRTTNKGTIGKLVDTSIYDINADVEQPPEQPAINHPATIKQPLTRMKERKKERKKAPPSPLPPQTAAPAALKEIEICSLEQRRALRANLPKSMQEILRAREEIAVTGGQK